MAQDRSRLTIDNREADAESEIELVEVDAASYCATFSSQTSASLPVSARSRTPPGSGNATSPAADLDAAAAPDGAARSAGSDELAEAAEPSASTARSVFCDSGACEQDRLLKELIGKLAEQGGCANEEESPPEADADSDYVRIEPHEANECHMTWSGSSVSSRFSFLVPRTQSEEDLASQPSDTGDVGDEPAPSGLHDVDDREESDQALSLVTLGAPVDGVRLAGGGRAGPALLQQPFQPQRLWLRDGEDAPRVALADVDVAAHPLVRHYKHRKNSDVNRVLSAIAIAALVLAVGIGIGHCIGTAREASLQRQIRDDQDSKLRELREDLLMCLRKQEDISQTITKLNEIEAILIDAEHWRNEYEELLKLKVQAEDGWRLERASILDQLAQSKAELSRVTACHRDSELLSRQQVKLDENVHAKLQAALEHKQKQAVNQQERPIASPPLDCREKVGLGGFVSQINAELRSPPANTCLTSRRPDADRCWTAAEDSSSDKAQLRGCARLVLAARERRRATAAVGAKAASAGAAMNGCGNSKSLGQMALDRSLRLYTASFCKGGDNADSRVGGVDGGLEASGSRNDEAASSGNFDDAVAVVRDEKAETALQRTLSTLLGVAEHTLSAVKRVANSSLHVLSKAANTSLHIMSKAANRSLLALSKAANRSLHFQSKSANSSLNVTDRSKDTGLSAIGSSMDVPSNVSDRWFHFLFKAEEFLTRVANRSADVAFKFINSSFDAVSKIADRSLNALSKVANSSLVGQSNDSAALLETTDRPSAGAVAAGQKVNMTKVREAAAFVRTGVHLVGKAMQQALSSVADAVKKLSSSGTRQSAPGTSKEPVTDGAGDKDETVVDRSPSMLAEAAAATTSASDAFATTVDESQFWAEFKELRQLVNNFTKRAGVAGESDRTYKALLAFVQRYSDGRKRRGMPPGVEWRAWCDCQLAWWTGRLEELDVVRGAACSERLAEWQVDALETDAASGTSALDDVVLDVTTAESGDDRRDPGWFFERAAEREFVRDTPDDWYWRKMKEAYVQVYKLLTDGQPRH